VSAGAKQALFNACFTLFGPGDEVLLPTPYWTSYPDILSLAGRGPYSCRAIRKTDSRSTLPPRRRLDGHADAWADPELAEQPDRRRVRAHELDAILLWAAEHGLWVISDEIYGRLCYTADRAGSVLDVDPSLLEHVVLVDGVSKTFAMTGWRVGFSYCVPALAAQRFESLQSHITSGASSPAQAAALAAYRDEARVREAVRAMVRVFRRRRDSTAAALREALPDARFTMPDGAFFIFLRVDAYYDDGPADSIAFCRDLLETTGVALVPGAAFGDDRYVSPLVRRSRSGNPRGHPPHGERVDPDRTVTDRLTRRRLEATRLDPSRPRAQARAARSARSVPSR
jgi:aspartate aminotransferase